MFIHPENMAYMKFPDFKINDELISVVRDYVYLGHIICKDLSDDLDILK